MNLLNSLQSEILKVKGSPLLWCCLAGGLLLPIVFVTRNLLIGSHMNAFTMEEPWERVCMVVFRPFAAFLIPLGGILVCSLIAQVEYQNNNWKQVHTTPQAYWAIFLAKYSVLFLLVFGVSIVLNVGTIMLGIIPCLVLDGKLPESTFPVDFFLKQSLTSFVYALPIIALQFLLSMRFKDFMVAIGFGFTIYIGTMMALRFELSYLSPYSFVLVYFDDLLGHEPVNYQLPLVYFALISFVSYYLYVTKKLKG